MTTLARLVRIAFIEVVNNVLSVAKLAVAGIILVQVLIISSLLNLIF